MKTLHSDNGLHVALRQGDPDRRLLLVHGQLLNHSVWNMPEDVFRDVSVAVLDLPGHGKSSIRGYPADVPGLAAALPDALDVLGWPSCVALGHSLGARCLLHAGLTDPARFQRQLLVGLPGDLTSEQRAQMKAFGQLVRNSGFSADIVGLAHGIWYSQQYAESNPDLASEIRRRLEKNDPMIAATIFDGIARMPDLRGQLGDYRPTVDILSADQDQSTPRSAMEPLATELGAQITDLSGGHMIFEERPTDFWSAAERWFD